MAPGGVLYVIAVFGAGDEFGETVSAASKFFDGLTMNRWIEAEVAEDCALRVAASVVRSAFTIAV